MESLRFASHVSTPVTRRLSLGNRVGFRISARAGAEPDLSVTANGLKMPNPFVIGSGPPGTNYTVMKRAFNEGWGAVIAKTVPFYYTSFLIAKFLIGLNIVCFLTILDDDYK